MKYKNSGRTTKTFYGITFRPGDIKDVPGYINATSFIPVKDTKTFDEKSAIDSLNKSVKEECKNVETKSDEKKSDNKSISSSNKNNQSVKQVTDDSKQEEKKSESKSDNKKQDESRDVESKDKNK